MSELTQGDLHLIVSRLPRYMRAVLKNNPNRAVLAGGFIRATLAGERPSDIDIFGPDKTEMETWATDIVLESKGEARLHTTDNAYTVLWKGARMPAQFIHRWTYEQPADVIASFDFTIAQAAIWCEPQNENPEKVRFVSHCSDRFYSDLAARRLWYTFPQRNEDAGGSLLRVRKFLARGYNIQAEALAGVIARLCGAVRWENHMVGDERGLAKVLTGLLREVDPLIVVGGVELVDEHQAIDADEQS